MVGPGVEPLRVTFVVHRRLFRLKLVQRAETLKFDLYRKTPTKLHVALDTKLNESETVQLSGDDKGTSPVAKEVKFKSLSAKQKDVMLQIAELGKAWQVSGGPNADAKSAVEISLGSKGRLPAGNYAGEVYLVGDGVTTEKLTLKIRVDDFYVAIKNKDGQYEPAPPILPFFVLANNRIAQNLAICSVLNPQQPISATEVEIKQPPFALASVGGVPDQLPLKLSNNGLRLDMAVPASVREGIYQAPLAFTHRDGPSMVECGLTLQVQVAHFGAWPELKKGEPLHVLRLELDQACGSDARATFNLVSTAPAPPAVRWSVQYQPDASDKERPPLERLDVLFDGNSVLSPNKPRDSISKDSPCKLTVTANCAGLAPGLYRGKLRFDSWVDSADEKSNKKSMCEMYVEVLVSGRKITSVTPGFPRPPVEGGKVDFEVKLSCYNCKPGSGELIPLDVLRKKEPRYAKPVKVLEKDGKQGAFNEWKVYTCRVSADIRHAGVNQYELSWPSHCTGRSPETFSCKVDANGLIRSVDESFYVDQVPVFKVLANPQPAGAAPIRLLVVEGKLNGRDPNLVAEHDVIELFDDGNLAEHGDDRAGDGWFSGKYKFTNAGWYTLVHRPGPKDSLRLQPKEVLVAFKFDTPVVEGNIYYAVGGICKPFLSGFLDVDELRMDNVVRLRNLDARPCEFKATLTYPAMPLNQRENKDQVALAGIEAVEYDPELHLDGSLTGSTETKRQLNFPDKNTVSGTLGKGEELELDSFVKVSQEAKNAHFQGSGNHLTLGTKNGMIVKIELTWKEDDGTELKRTVYAPVTVQTQDLGWAASIVNTVIIVALLAAAGACVWWLRRHGYLTPPKRPKPDEPAAPTPRPDDFDEDESPQEPIGLPRPNDFGNDD